jgi:hypothetical protein
LFPLLGNEFWNFFCKNGSCTQSETSYGEQFFVNATLCLISLKFAKNQGEQIKKKALLYLTKAFPSL